MAIVAFACMLWRGAPAVLAAPLAAAAVVLALYPGTPVTAFETRFAEPAGTFFEQYLAIFVMGAMFGRIMVSSCCTASLARPMIAAGSPPVFLLPTATREVLGTEQFGIGPTAVVLKQTGPWTHGMLANHIWSVAGDDDRADVSTTFLQPFASYTTPDAWTFTAQTEATRNWEANEDEWTVPIGAFVSKVVDVGGQKISLQGGPRW